MSSDPIVIAGMARTPMGGFRGELTPLSASQLGSAAIARALDEAGIEADRVEQTFMGCVLPAGLGQAPARQAALGAGLPRSVACTTVNKMCGSGMQAAILAHDALVVGSADVIVAGGMESMSNAPYLAMQVRGGQRMGNGDLKDHMFLDGLEDAYEPGRLMGSFAQATADHYGFTREAQDEFAIASLKRAQKATTDGSFAREVVPVTVRERKGEREISIDEQPAKADLAKIPTLKPAFAKDGTVTAANSSSISDGGAALVMVRASTAERRGAGPRAGGGGPPGHAHEPALFTTAPVGAIRKLFERTGWSRESVELWEINEAFAVVTMVAMKELGLPHDAVNVHGGACALGHPIGCSGARIMVTLIAAMEKYGLRRGVASLCIGGGEATAVAIERAE
jgi:acetyl-CoA C-acetyltransferase